ncbi:MAG: NAD-dependent epimerase/dehydratase family protein [Elusimicrobiota bacterium]
MRLLFIGGTGAISNACARLCLEQGHELTLLLRGTRDERIPAGAKVLHGDIKKDASPLRGLGYDCVVDWTVLREEDAERDVALFKGRTGRFFYISSTSVYTKPLASPRVDEGAPIGNPLWSYADQKARCESILLNGLPAVVVRPGHCYAEFTCPSGFAGLGFGVVDRILQGKPVVVHGDGAGLWTLTHSSEFAGLFVPLLREDGVLGEVFQIASREVLTWTRIYETMGEALGKPVRLVNVPVEEIARIDPELGATLLGDKAHSCAPDSSKVRGRIASPRPVSFREGFERSLEWRRRHPEAPYDRGRYELMDRIAGGSR